MRRMYALRHNPDFLQQLWRRAWPENVWDELLANGFPACASWMRIHVKVLIESETELAVPWEWLYGPFMRAPYDVLESVLGQRPSTQVGISLHRPAEGGKYQEVMLTHFLRGEEEQWEWEFETFSRQSHYTFCRDANAVALPDEQQQVAVTGSWCHKLPNADTPLWRVQQGCTSHPDGVTDGDCFYDHDHAIATASVDSRSSLDIDEADWTVDSISLLDSEKHL